MSLQGTDLALSRSVVGDVDSVDIYFRKTQLNSRHETRVTRQEDIRHDSVCDVMRLNKISEIFDFNPWFQSLHSILASYGQEFAPATASYGLAGPDLAWRANKSKRVQVRYVYCSDYS